VAAPSLLREHPVSDDGEDQLASLPWLALKTYYRNEVLLKHIERGEQRRIAIRPRVSTDSLYALRSAALQGLGVCIGSTWLLADDIQQGRLVRLAPDWCAAPLPVYITYPYARFYPSRLLRFVAKMREVVPGAISGP